MKKRKIVKRKRVTRTPKPARPAVQIVGVNFPSSLKVYHYQAPRGWLIAEGDKVVVDSPFSGYMVVKVVDVKQKANFCGYTSLKWIVSQIDDTEYKARTEHERALREMNAKTERRRRLEMQIEALEKELGLLY